MAILNIRNLHLELLVANRAFYHGQDRNIHHLDLSSEGAEIAKYGSC